MTENTTNKSKIDSPANNLTDSMATLPVNTENESIKIPIPTTEASRSDKNNIQVNKASPSTSTLSVNTESKNENEPEKATDKSYKPSQNDSTNKFSVNTGNNTNNLKNRITDETNSTQEPPKNVVTTENSVEPEIQAQNTVNTENTNEAATKNNNASNVLGRSTPENEPSNVNTENTTQVHATLTSSMPINSKQTNPKEDWSSLTFSSDDSLFEEMTKQLEDDTNKNGVLKEIAYKHNNKCEYFNSRSRYIARHCIFGEKIRCSDRTFNVRCGPGATGCRNRQ